LLSADEEPARRKRESNKKVDDRNLKCKAELESIEGIKED